MVMKDADPSRRAMYSGIKLLLLLLHRAGFDDLIERSSFGSVGGSGTPPPLKPLLPPETEGLSSPSGDLARGLSNSKSMSGKHEQPALVSATGIVNRGCAAQDVHHAGQQGSDPPPPHAARVAEGQDVERRLEAVEALVAGMGRRMDDGHEQVMRKLDLLLEQVEQQQRAPATPMPRDARSRRMQAAEVDECAHRRLDATQHPTVSPSLDMGGSGSRGWTRAEERALGKRDGQRRLLVMESARGMSPDRKTTWAMSAPMLPLHTRSLSLVAGAVEGHADSPMESEVGGMQRRGSLAATSAHKRPGIDGAANGHGRGMGGQGKALAPATPAIDASNLMLFPHAFLIDGWEGEASKAGLGAGSSCDAFRPHNHDLPSRRAPTPLQHTLPLCVPGAQAGANRHEDEVAPVDTSEASLSRVSHLQRYARAVERNGCSVEAVEASTAVDGGSFRVHDDPRHSVSSKSVSSKLPVEHLEHTHTHRLGHLEHFASVVSG